MRFDDKIVIMLLVKNDDTVGNMFLIGLRIIFKKDDNIIFK